jgi:hypothetical protein
VPTKTKIFFRWFRSAATAAAAAEKWSMRVWVVWADTRPVSQSFAERVSSRGHSCCTSSPFDGGGTPSSWMYGASEAGVAARRRRARGG